MKQLPQRKQSLQNTTTTINTNKSDKMKNMYILMSGHRNKEVIQMITENGGKISNTFTKKNNTFSCKR